MSTLARRSRDRQVRVGLSVVAGLVIVAGAVSAQLGARLTGDEYRLRVAPFDPVDPFRGAYVELDYPDLPHPDQTVTLPAAEEDLVYLPLQRRGDLWTGAPATRTRPNGPFLRCDDQQWRYRCGIESWFLPEGDAAAAGKALADGTAVAVLKVDSRGNAAIVELRTAG